MVFGKGDKVYIISDKGNKKEGRVVAGFHLVDSVRYYKCMFDNVEASLPESKINPLITEQVQ